MKKLIFTLKRQVLVLGMLCCGIVLMAEQVVVTVTTKSNVAEGGLYNALLAKGLSDADIAEITDLKIISTSDGYLSTDDFKMLNNTADAVVGMSDLTSLDLSEAWVTSQVGRSDDALPGSAFLNNTKIKDLILPVKLKSVGRNTFQGSSCLPELLILPEGFLSVDRNSFTSVKNLKVVIFPSTLYTTGSGSALGNNAFDGCSNVEQYIFMGGTIPLLGTDIFKDNSSSVKIGVPSGSLEAYQTLLASYFSAEQIITTQQITFVNNASSPQGNIAIPGTSVSITANDPVKTFKNWSSVPSVTFASASNAETTFTMPSEDITIIAVYNEDAAQSINITGGKAYVNSSEVTEAIVGDVVTIVATEGPIFEYWMSNDVVFDNANSSTTTFVMPPNAVTITASAYEPLAPTITLTTEKPRISDWLTNEQLPQVVKLTIISDGQALVDADFAVLNDMIRLEELNMEGLSNTAIPASAFNGNQYIKKIKLPSGLASIGGSAFNNCALEGEIYLPTPLTTNNIETSRFGDSPNITGFVSENTTNQNGLKTVDGVVYNFWGTQLQYYPRGKEDESLVISNTVIYSQSSTTDRILIRDLAIANNPYLKTIILSSKTTQLQTQSRPYYIGQNCPNLSAIYVDEGNDVFGSLDGILFTEKTTVNVPSAFTTEELIIDGTKVEVATIPTSSISGLGVTSSLYNSGLKSLVLTEGVTSVGGFRNVTTLESVEFPESLTTLASSAFENTSVSSAIFKGENLSLIGGLAFKNAKLEKLDLPASITELGGEALNGNTYLDLFIVRSSSVPTIYATTLNSVGWRNNTANTKVYVPADMVADYLTSNWIDGTNGYKGFAANQFVAFYNLVITDGTALSTLGSDISFEGDIVTITASTAPSGQVFDKWEVTAGTIADLDENNPTTTFTMPASDVTIVAKYRDSAPIAATWIGSTGENATDWSTPSNWQDGIVPGLTDNAIISASASSFPVLKEEDEAAVNTITFEPGAELGRQDLLMHSQAFVEYDLAKKRWNMITHPFIEPLKVKDFYWSGNPHVYVKQFTIDATKADEIFWVSATKTSVELPVGKGFMYSINENDVETATYPMRIPAASNTVYTLNKSTYWQEDVAFGYGGTGYENANNFAFLANPVMTTIDFKEFLKDNSTLSGNYMIWGESGLVGYTPDGKWGSHMDIGSANTSLTNTGYQYIAPLQSFIVENTSKNKSETITFDITNIAATNVEEEVTLRNAVNPINKLNIIASNKNGSVLTFIANRENRQDARKLFSGVENVNAEDAMPDIYTLKAMPNGQTAALGANIINTHEITVPLALATTASDNITLTFSGMDSYDANILFVDTQGESIDLTGKESETYTFSYAGSSTATEDRFRLEFTPRKATGLNDASTQNLLVYGKENRIHVITPSADPIKQVSVYNIQGQILYTTDNVNALSYVSPALTSSEIYVVKVITEKGIKNVKVRMQ